MRASCECLHRRTTAGYMQSDPCGRYPKHGTPLADQLLLERHLHAGDVRFERGGHPSMEDHPDSSRQDSSGIPGVWGPCDRVKAKITSFRRYEQEEHPMREGQV